MHRREYLVAMGGSASVLIPATTAANQDLSYDVEIVETNAPVRAGDVLVVRAGVFNSGSDVGPAPIWIHTGDDALDQTELEVPVGESYPISPELTYETYPVERDVRFPIHLESESDHDQTDVDVLTSPDGAVDVEIVSTNAPVSGGEELTARVHVSNTGTVAQTQSIELVAGKVVDSETVTVGESNSVSFQLGYRTYDTQQDVTFDLVARSDDASNSRQVQVDAR